MLINQLFFKQLHEAWHQSLFTAGSQNWLLDVLSLFPVFYPVTYVLGRSCEFSGRYRREFLPVATWIVICIAMLPFVMDSWCHVCFWLGPVFGASCYDLFTWLKVIHLGFMHGAYIEYVHNGIVCRTHFLALYSFVLYFHASLFLSHFAITHKPWVWKMVGLLHDFYHGASMLVWTYQVSCSSYAESTLPKRIHSSCLVE